MKNTTKDRDKNIIYTIGHSTRSIEEFIDILKKYNINQLIDVRTVPKSRHNPQFNKDVFGKKLRNRSINYAHYEKLGGLRHVNKDSINTGWRNASFQGYADYMQTANFEVGIDKLIEKSQNKNVAIMCAEAVPWRCHRSMIADALLKVNKIPVVHILSEKSSYPHKITSFAKVRKGKVIYPPTD